MLCTFCKPKTCIIGHKVCGSNIKMCIGITSWRGERALREKKSFALALTTMCTNNVRSFAVIRITSVSQIRAFVCKHWK
jgi:hypothetical protein